MQLQKDFVVESVALTYLLEGVHPHGHHEGLVVFQLHGLTDNHKSPSDNSNHKYLSLLIDS